MLVHVSLKKHNFFKTIIYLFIYYLIFLFIYLFIYLFIFFFFFENLIQFFCEKKKIEIFSLGTFCCPF